MAQRSSNRDIVPYLISSILLAFLQFSWPPLAVAIAADLTGPVVSVLDGIECGGAAAAVNLFRKCKSVGENSLESF